MRNSIKDRKSNCYRFALLDYFTSWIYLNSFVGFCCVVQVVYQVFPLMVHFMFFKFNYLFCIVNKPSSSWYWNTAILLRRFSLISTIDFISSYTSNSQKGKSIESGLNNLPGNKSNRKVGSGKVRCFAGAWDTIYLMAGRNQSSKNWFIEIQLAQI